MSPHMLKICGINTCVLPTLDDSFPKLSSVINFMKTTQPRQWKKATAPKIRRTCYVFQNFSANIPTKCSIFSQ